MLVEDDHGLLAEIKGEQPPVCVEADVQDVEPAQRLGGLGPVVNDLVSELPGTRQRHFLPFLISRSIDRSRRAYSKHSQLQGELRVVAHAQDEFIEPTFTQVACCFRVQRIRYPALAHY